MNMVNRCIYKILAIAKRLQLYIDEILYFKRGGNFRFELILTFNLYILKVSLLNNKNLLKKVYIDATFKKMK